MCCLTSYSKATLSLLQWVPVLTDFQWKDSVWGFVPPPDKPPANEFHPLITLHLGDYNLDGFPDALAILKNTSSR